MFFIIMFKFCKIDTLNENHYRSQMEQPQNSKPPLPKALTAPGKAPQRISSEALLGQSNELVIVHNGREYKLRLTQLGKLILTA
jgi:hemin uptake protein HemP